MSLRNKGNIARIRMWDRPRRALNPVGPGPPAPMKTGKGPEGKNEPKENTAVFDGGSPGRYNLVRSDVWPQVPSVSQSHKNNSVFFKGQTELC